MRPYPGSSQHPSHRDAHWERAYRISRGHKRRFLLWRFAGPFGAMLFFFLVCLLVVFWLAYEPLRQAFPQPWVLLLVVCGLPLAFALLSTTIGGLMFRRISRPLAELMTAIDALAAGELSVRVTERYRGEFGRLAHSFNRMASELERAEQQRRNLTADVAHELRTPLHIIQGNLEGLLDGVYQATPEQLEATLDETRLLARLVNDLQTLSLAEAGQLPLHRQALLAEDLLEDARTSFAGQAVAAGVTLQIRAAEGAGELTLYGDPDRLDQVLANLVSNALQHTPAGGEIDLEARAAAGGLELTVRDSGQGIAAEYLPYIFDRFWRGDPARTRRVGAGSGLGLAITRQIVQAHGGHIGVESQAGQGATFTVWLPLADTQPISTDDD
jgi:signal transduction histidine kinase